MDRLSSRIKMARNKAGMTQQELADELKISRGAIGQWESGRTSPTLENLYAVASVCEIPIEWLVGEDHAHYVSRLATKLSGGGTAPVEEESRSITSKMAEKFWAVVEYNVLFQDPSLGNFFNRSVELGDSELLQCAYASHHVVVDFQELDTTRTLMPRLRAALGKVLLAERLLGVRKASRLVVLWAQSGEANEREKAVFAQIKKRLGVQVMIATAPQQASDWILHAEAEGEDSQAA